jgi:acyl-[acyl-carrier-protein]-phospholipid O-acyltransferase/long-chain-fatty-acid--[acyl-carrier-protein] ligase
MGCHSTLFGPAKYAILPQHLGSHEIMGGTGLVEAGTFLAILAGQLLAGWVPPWEAALLAMGFALLGFLVSLAVPAAPPVTADLRIDPNPLRATWNLVRNARHAHNAWLCILGISWFFAVGAVLLSEFAPMASGVLGAGQSVVQFFPIVFSVSIAIGSMLVNRLLAGEVSARYVPVSALALSAFLIDLWLATSGFVPQVRGAGVAAFLATPGSWRIMVDLVGIAFSGGMFIVPLYALLQTESPAAERSRVIAANNIINAAVTVLVVGIVTVLLGQGVGIPGLLAALGFSTLVVALISCWLLPRR